MSYLHLDPNQIRRKKNKGSARNAFSTFLLENYGQPYGTVLEEQAVAMQAPPTGLVSEAVSEEPPLTVGIIGGGFAGMYAGLILQSLGIECEVFEASDRVGGRIDTWYSTQYDPNDVNKAALYGEVGGMRLPQFADDMLPVQHLSLCLNSVLERNGLKDKLVEWRKFYYNSDQQRLRYNNMEAPILAENAALNSLNFGEKQGGDLDPVWVTEVTKKGETYLPVNKILDKVNGEFLDALDKSFEDGFTKLMKYDNYSMWGYLTNVFQLKQLEEYYDKDMGDPDDHLPYSVASYLETTNVGTGMYAVSFVEMVIAVYDWGGSLNPYDTSDPQVYMLTVNQGMQHFPDACRTVLDLDKGVLPDDGLRAAQLLGQKKGTNHQFGYSPTNLTPDAEPPTSVPKAEAIPPVAGEASTPKKRVFLNHRVNGVSYDNNLFNGKGGVKVRVEHDGQQSEKQYRYVISTLPNGKYLNGQEGASFFEGLTFSKRRALRECNYMPSFKAFITFKNQFWKTLGEREGHNPQHGLGVAASDRPNRQVVYPSYGYDAKGGVLQIYCWAQDAERMGALSDEERVNECLKGIQYMYPEVDVYEAFAGYKPGETTKTWFWDNHAGGGAFALFNPGQFKNLYPTLLTPEFKGSLNIAGECCSVHHGWIVGALDSAFNAVQNILHVEGDQARKELMKKTWGGLGTTDTVISKNPVMPTDHFK